MARRRFFVEEIRQGRAELRGEAAEHLRRVLRAERGQRYEISDNRAVYLAEIVAFGPARVELRVLERLEDQPLPVRLHLLVALIKFDRFEWMLEKATELGVESVIPIETVRSQKGLRLAAPKRLERWRRIVLESSQQARRQRPPEVEWPQSLREALAWSGPYRYVLDEAKNLPPLLAALPPPNRRLPADSVALLVGPEGGWTETEREAARKADWVAVSLGPLIMRTETAAIAALAVLANAWAAAERLQ
ncbi:MAG: RsmE family RNA methyltransferase [Bryobacterales bacterium]|nr:16S rRNA (uracil(1498)-N(3))-methyltransferase [Bryobacteraceae bacterium]MDW8354987.1 RsmE family RNA methyltransferase [Bryobacterales bacterium]